VRGQPSPPAPLPHGGRGVIWFVNAVSLPSAGSPLLRSSPFLSRTWERKEGRGEGEGAALTPSPSPARRERGDLVRERGIVAICRIASAPLIPLPLPQRGSGRKAGGKVRGIIPLPLPQRGSGRKAGGKVRGIIPLPLPQRGRGGGQGGGEGYNPPSSPAAWERRGAGGR